MAKAYLPPMKQVPEGATKEMRKKMCDEYKAELRRLNPHHFNADGTTKTMWQWLSAIVRR